MSRRLQQARSGRDSGGAGAGVPPNHPENDPISTAKTPDITMPNLKLAHELVDIPKFDGKLSDAHRSLADRLPRHTPRRP